MVDFNTVTEFENKIASFFGAPYVVATDSCTHAIELCLRYEKSSFINCPNRTYISIPFIANKLEISLIWNNNKKWVNYYWLNSKIYDAAVLWGKNAYSEIPEKGKMMCISFQYQKHLSLGRGGMILLDNKEDAIQLKKMSYDGRLPNIPWREQNIDTIGYHYYMTPETAALGLQKLPEAIERTPRIWTSEDYPDLTKMDVFK